MEFQTVISHGDVDGLVSASLFLKKFGIKCNLYFTSAARLRDTICTSMIGKNELKELYIFDIAANEKTMLLSSLYEKVLWIDHHQWKIKKIPSNIRIFVDRDSPSTSQLVSNFFGIKSELVELANQIDRNKIETDEAKFLRDLVAAIKWRYKGSFLNQKLRSMAKSLALHGIEKFEQSEKIAELINNYLQFVKKIEADLQQKIKIFEVNGKKIAIYESMQDVPIYLVNNKLLNHEKAPFDIIAVITHRLDFFTKNISTKVELRTHTSFDVYKIADLLGGGGHRVAAGATLNKYLNADKILEKIKSVISD
jgi:oligoribonuclease NrnB/cAMP/cGMP phosphodiesterase (DHH superfamily)